MSSDVVATWIGAVATAGSAVAAGMAWKAAKASSGAAAELTALEVSRRHDELIPLLTVKIEPFNPGDLQHYRLTVELDGPIALIRLDSFTVKVRDDRPGRDQQTMIGSEATPEAVRAQVWGPLRFKPRLGPASARTDETGRSVTVTEALDVGEGMSFELERTLPPPWYRHQGSSDEVWRRDAGNVVRLLVVGVSDEAAWSWTLPIEVNLAADGVEGFSSATI